MVKKNEAAVPEITVEQLVSDLSKAGVQLFRQRSGMPLNQAQRNLEGLTHYVDDKSLSAFVAQIHHVYILEEGLLLALIESVQAGPNKESGRVYRPVLFDVFGNVIHQPTIDDSADSLKKANAQLWQVVDEMDGVQITIDGLKAKIKQLDDQSEKLTELLDSIQ